MGSISNRARKLYKSLNIVVRAVLHLLGAPGQGARALRVSKFKRVLCGWIADTLLLFVTKLGIYYLEYLEYRRKSVVNRRKSG